MAMLHKTIDIENVIPYFYDKTNAEKHFRDPSTKISAVSRGSEQEGRSCHIRQEYPSLIFTYCVLCGNKTGWLC